MAPYEAIIIAAVQCTDVHIPESYPERSERMRELTPTGFLKLEGRA
jgi:hypothetical protein